MAIPSLVSQLLSSSPLRFAIRVDQRPHSIDNAKFLRLKRYQGNIFVVIHKEQKLRNRYFADDLFPIPFAIPTKFV